MITIPYNTLWTCVGIIAFLILATAVTLALKTLNPTKDFTELSQRIRSWWVMLILFIIALSVSANLSMIFIGFLSFLAFKEFLSIIPTRRVDRIVLLWAYLAIPVQYYWVSIGWYGMFIIFIPVYIFLFLPMCMVLIGETKGFIRAAGTLHWSMMLTVFSISHMAYLLVLPEANNPQGGGSGLLLYLVFLTQFNDVAQYLWGKMIGKHKVIKKVSPNKTWEGLVGGFITSVGLAALLATWLTPLTLLEGAIAGGIISLGGFIGDVCVSAVKRDLGIKDSGNIIPGHGGVLDRVDSLMYTAPLFFHYIYYFYY